MDWINLDKIYESYQRVVFSDLTPRHSRLQYGGTLGRSFECELSIHRKDQKDFGGAQSSCLLWSNSKKKIFFFFWMYFNRGVGVLMFSFLRNDGDNHDKMNWKTAFVEHHHGGHDADKDRVRDLF